jgi:hypothetical protein
MVLTVSEVKRSGHSCADLLSASYEYPHIRALGASPFVLRTVRGLCTADTRSNQPYGPEL